MIKNKRAIGAAMGEMELLTSEIRSRLELMEANLPKHAKAMDLSRTVKLPFKALACRKALIWRMAELGRAALESFEENRLASGILLTRAAVETTAALWHLHAKIEATVQSGVIGDIDSHLMKLMLGSRTNPGIVPEPINVLTFVDRVNREVPGFRNQYDLLSEFAHPNWAGAMGLYSKPDPPNLSVDFGANIRGADAAKEIGVINLSVALMFFERSYNSMADLTPDFVALCEKSLGTEERT